MAGRGLLRSLLQHYTGQPAASWEFQLGPYGRPEADPSAPRFNLSHTRGTTIIAFTAPGVELGADVEARSRSDHWRLAERFFADDEAQEVRRARVDDKGELFLRFWTLKEAYVKAIGQGISIGLGSFAFTLSDQSPPQVRIDDGSSAGWHFYELPWPVERAAVAVRCPQRPLLVERQWDREGPLIG